MQKRIYVYLATKIINAHFQTTLQQVFAFPVHEASATPSHNRRLSECPPFHW